MHRKDNKRMNVIDKSAINIGNKVATGYRFKTIVIQSTLIFNLLHVSNGDTAIIGTIFNKTLNLYYYSSQYMEKAFQQNRININSAF